MCFVQDGVFWFDVDCCFVWFIGYYVFQFGCFWVVFGNGGSQFFCGFFVMIVKEFYDFIGFVKEVFVLDCISKDCINCQNIKWDQYDVWVFMCVFMGVYVFVWFVVEGQEDQMLVVERCEQSCYDQYLESIVVVGCCIGVFDYCVFGGKVSKFDVIIKWDIDIGDCESIDYYCLEGIGQFFVQIVIVLYVLFMVYIVDYGVCVKEEYCFEEGVCEEMEYCD